MRGLDARDVLFGRGPGGALGVERGEQAGAQRRHQVDTRHVVHVLHLQRAAHALLATRLC